MSLNGFKEKAHPQQTRGRALVSAPHLTAPAEQDETTERDERYTRLEDFAPWHEELRHTLDAAGCPEAPVSRLIGRWCGRGGIAEDGLFHPWDGEIVWCNGPYSSIRPWIEKAWASKAVVDSLWPANRTEQPWWQDLVEPYRDRGILRCQFLGSRRQFGTPTAPHAAWNSSPPFGVVRLTWATPERPQHLCPPPPNQLRLL